jgi:hypothetical protein
MWPFNSKSKLDRRVRAAWGNVPWKGIECGSESLSDSTSPRVWANKIVKLAKKTRSPFMVSLGKTYGTAVSGRTNQTVMWGFTLRMICPLAKSGVDVISTALGRDCRGDIGGEISERDFPNFDEALEFCEMDYADWRIHFNAPHEFPKGDSAPLPKDNLRGLAIFIELPKPTANYDAETAFLVGMSYQAVKLDPNIPQLLISLKSNINVFFETSCDDAVRSMCEAVHAAHPALSCWVLAGRYTGQHHPIPFSCKLLFIIDDDLGKIVNVTTGLEWKQNGLQIVASN